MLKIVYNSFVSLRMTNILIVILIGFHIVGAVVMPASSSFEFINKMALFTWLGQVSFQVSWWIYGTIVALGLITINTIVCSVDSLLRKKEGTSPLLAISPQIIHAGFCFILLAHLFSAFSASHQEAVLSEGYSVELDSGAEVRLDKVRFAFEKGQIPEMMADISYHLPDGSEGKGTLSANHPVFVMKTGVYLKDATSNPSRALLIFSYEPGAVWALTGSILFLVGTAVFCLKSIYHG